MAKLYYQKRDKGQRKQKYIPASVKWKIVSGILFLICLGLIYEVHLK